MWTAMDVIIAQRLSYRFKEDSKCTCPALQGVKIGQTVLASIDSHNCFCPPKMVSICLVPQSCGIQSSQNSFTHRLAIPGFFGQYLMALFFSVPCSVEWQQLFHFTFSLF